MQSIWWQIFDFLGTAAFALSGSLVAILRRMDIFGIFVLSAATAVGGGIIRDILLGRIPPAAFSSSYYLWIILAMACVMSFHVRYDRGHTKTQFFQALNYMYIVCDALGLGSFTVTGTLLGCALYPDLWVLDITLGVITAVGGGVIRDVLAGRIPEVLRQDVYATASLIGAAVLYVLYRHGGFSADGAAITAFVVTVFVRLVAVRFHLNLPHVRRK